MASSPVSLYVHMPWCSSKCDYCDFYSRPCSAVPDSYIQAVINQASYFARTAQISSWKTVYVGGGTPSLMTPGQMETLCQGIMNSTGSPFVPEEFTMEMNPQSLSPEKLHAAANGGIDRLSLGIQSLTEEALRAVNRHCTARTARNALDTVKSHWKGRLSLDAIAGLPEQDDGRFESSLKSIIEYSPDHISLYTLTVEEGTPLDRNIQSGKISLPEDLGDNQWILGRQILESGGYAQYEVSNFARPGEESLHNSAYWAQQDYAGCGSGATSSFYSRDDQGKIHGALRITGTTDTDVYTRFWLDGDNLNPSRLPDPKSIPGEKEELDAQTCEFEFLMTGLRTLDGISAGEYRKCYGHLKWNGDLEKRLGKADGIWHEYESLGRTRESIIESPRQLPQGTPADRRFSLNSQGILFLNDFLVNLL
ncbi:MAG: radical SAM family heme chaperone HemW [Treponema sp.]|nr:radical SAM family heme chaperone HemW [Treponema sp.]